MINGKKVILREIKNIDTNNIIKWRNSEEVNKNFFERTKLTVEMHNLWLLNRVKQGEVKQFIIVDKISNIDIGSTFIKDIDSINGKCEYGIFIGENKFKGQGLGSEVAILVSEYAFNEMELHKIYLRVFAHNIGAIKSYEKAGFKKVGLLVDEIKVDNKYYNVVLMEKIRGEFK